MVDYNKEKYIWDILDNRGKVRATVEERRTSNAPKWNPVQQRGLACYY